MIAYNFHPPAGEVASSKADDGQGKFPQHTLIALHTAAQLTYRANSTGGGEQQLVTQFIATAGDVLPHALFVHYYVSLKVHPFVVVTGPPTTGSNMSYLSEAFAQTLFGSHSHQLITIGNSNWVENTREQSFYRSMHERFSSFSFLETLHEALSPAGSGKLYLVFLKGFHADELRSCFSSWLQVAPTGEKRLALPGLKLAQQPVLPPNMFLVAATQTLPPLSRANYEVLRHGGLVDLQTTPALSAPIQHPPPPVGYQRIMLASTVRGEHAAWSRLNDILDPEQLRHLRPSRELVQMLWQQRVVRGTTLLDNAVVYIANSFDMEGRGLFDATDVLRNAQIAYDVHVVQRVLWRLRLLGDTQQQERFARYFEQPNLSR